MNKLVGLFFGVMLGTTIVASPAQALSSSSASSNIVKPAPIYREYLTIDEKQTPPELRNRTFNYVDSEFGVNTVFAAAKKVVLNLLKWNLHSEDRPVPDEAYIRKLHFGRWINDPMDDTCMNTRAKVLVRDSEEDVTFRGQRRCVVESGKWVDPYSAEQSTSSKELQIDHMVPLKHAYMAGAWRWDYKTRCLYANYLGYKDHLIPATVHENTSKGDRGPNEYLPPDLSYRCEYVKNWLMIKMIWGLNMTMDEAQAIHEVVTNYGCDAGKFKVTAEDLRAQREYITSNLEFCMINKR